MKLCISQATTMSTPFEGDLDAYALAGWSSVELWLTKLEAFVQGRSIGEAQALLDDRVVCCFVTSEAVDVTGDGTRPPPASSPCTDPRLADVSRSASYCAPLVP